MKLRIALNSGRIQIRIRLRSVDLSFSTTVSSIIGMVVAAWHVMKMTF